MGTPEDLWNRLKLTAQGFPSRHIEREQAKSLVLRLVYHLHINPKPPPDAIEFYVRELQRMTDKENTNDLFAS